MASLLSHRQMVAPLISATNPCGGLPAGCRQERSATGAAPGDEAVHKRELLPARRDWGEKRALRPPRGSSSRPGKRARQNRLRHLLTIWRGVSSREAITSLERPWTASRMILARMTSQYGDVYWRTKDSRCCRSSLDKTTRKRLSSRHQRQSS